MKVLSFHGCGRPFTYLFIDIASAASNGLWRFELLLPTPETSSKNASYRIHLCLAREGHARSAEAAPTEPNKQAGLTGEILALKKLLELRNDHVSEVRDKQTWRVEKKVSERGYNLSMVLMEGYGTDSATAVEDEDGGREEPSCRLGKPQGEPTEY
ncbi:hypothetical protein B0H19DRAFT_1385548 [Mycena capillaripes]|nr:hypothetical protein B0H19DRAFT_1385548 [Mycena capillaripes]